MADAAERIEAVTVAKIRGHRVGGGVVLASACDLRMACDRQMVGLVQSWSDADGLLAGLADPEGRRAAQRYLKQVRKEWRGAAAAATAPGRPP